MIRQPTSFQSASGFPSADPPSGFPISGSAGKSVEVRPVGAGSQAAASRATKERGDDAGQCRGPFGRGGLVHPFIHKCSIITVRRRERPSGRYFTDISEMGVVVSYIFPGMRADHGSMIVTLCIERIPNARRHPPLPRRECGGGHHPHDREADYAFVERTLVRFRYHFGRSRAGKGLVRRYLAKVTGYSGAQS